MTGELETLRIALALVERSDRPRAVRRLAQHADAIAIFGLIQDPELGLLVPAPGFASTLPGGRGWRVLLAALEAPGIHHCDIPPARGCAPEPAIACAGAGAALVFVGARTQAAVVDVARELLPALGSALSSEQEIAIATGALYTAQEGARTAQMLTQALDLARAELETKARSLDDARARAEQGTRAKDEFLAMLGHELRNPLAPIVTALELMRFRGLAAREQEIIERHVQHMLRLVDDLLDVSRITRGKVELQRECIELAEVASRAIEMASPLFEQRRQVLEVEVPPVGLAVDADPQRLAQILANLLTNASRYSGPGSSVRLQATRDHDRVRIAVIDEGIGIEPAMLGEIFGAFVQQRQSRAQGGLGLGLAIVASLVALHGGEVRAHSQGLGQGSEFVVELPASTGDPTHASTRPSAPIEIGPARPRVCERVLVVDDNEDAAELLSDVLRRLGHEVHTANDGPSALVLAEQMKPTVALLDIGLPGMDGFELAERLAVSCVGARPRLVAITGYGQQTDRQRSQAAGFDAHLVKPVDLELLERVLAELQAR